MTIYDLENRTFKLSSQVYEFSRQFSYSRENDQILKQLIRSASSVGANYIEANESFSKKDFIYRIKICRKEAKETIYWLRLLIVQNEEIEIDRELLLNEARELHAIFGKIYRSSTRNK